MPDIYATPESDLAQSADAKPGGSSVEAAIAGNFEVGMLETLGQAWRGMKGFKLKCHIALGLYFLVFIGIAIALGVLIFFLLRTGADQSVVAILNILAQLVATVIALPMGFALLIMAMRHRHEKSVSAGEIFRHFGSMFNLFVAYILQMIFILIGFLLLVLPGIYLMFAYMFAMPLIVEKKLGPWQALETSRKALTRVWMRFVGFILLMSFVNMLGLLTLGIAWIWTIPWSILAMALVYEKIFGVETHTLAD